MAPPCLDTARGQPHMQGDLVGRALLSWAGSFEFSGSILAQRSNKGRSGGILGSPLEQACRATATIGSVMQDSFDLTTLIFLGLAVFVIWRLRSVLGQKTGAERSPFKPVDRNHNPSQPTRSEGDNVVRLPGADRVQPQPDSAPAAAAVARDWRGIAEPGSAVAHGLEAIVQAEPNFDPRAFVEGAKGAYEAIVIAFAKGDRKTLRSLLSREVCEGFEREITARESRRETVETTFVSLDKAEIVAVDVRNKVAQVTVHFLSHLITATRSADGQVIDGNAEAVAEVPDVWTFARTLGSRDPNWQLVATEAGA